MNKSIITERIKQLRKEAKHTQENLAEKMDFTTEALQKIEQGVNKLSVENAIKIADIYDVSVDWLCGRIEDRNNPKDDLDVLKKYITYQHRERLPFEKPPVKDDDPFVYVKVNTALHEYLMGCVEADIIISKLDGLPSEKRASKLFLDDVKEKFINDISTCFKHDFSSAYFVDPFFVDRTKFIIEKSDTE